MHSHPEFYDPEQIPRVFVERVADITREAQGFAAKNPVKSAASDDFRVCAFGIDAQIGFCTPGASLFVPGAVEDTQRTIEWLYRNLEQLTELTFSLDTHSTRQIFHPAWWVDENGNQPPPFTPIFANDVASGRYRALYEPEQSYEYVQRLETSGKYVLTIWPYHTLLGGVSHALVPALMEAALFHGMLRQTEAHFEIKGAHPLTENYSVFSPEVTELRGQTLGNFNDPLFARLMTFDRVYVFGQAKSHCVLSTLRDLAAKIGPANTHLLSKIWILEDAMSTVPAPPLADLPAHLDFPRLADDGLRELRALGMRIARTSDPIAS
jgi:nicotinamidase-related amidase